ncbi:Rieske (2Fe-2S) protein [Sulfolobus tengchongensis]|uniref:Rieske (2Fe-2S) protein n=1 Tax=Sulfolobus tengchongensis TaxID=207809 RepID=A0AAX4L3R9_9CREN
MLIRVCKLSDLEDKKPKKFSLKGDYEVVLIKIGNNVFAIEAYCPHKGGNMEYGDIILRDTEYVIKCHLHGYEYNLKNGKLIFNPYGDRKGRWYYSPDLRIFEVKIIDDEIYIEV